MVNAKKSLSSNRLARDLDMNQKSAWYMQQRIRAAMLTEESELLHCNVGASREKRMTVMTTPQTSVDAAQKTPVLGAVEQGRRCAGGSGGEDRFRAFPHAAGGRSWPQRWEEGRIDGADTVTVTRQEVITSLHEPEKFILAIVLVENGFAREPRYVRKPFTQEPEFGVTAIQMNIKSLLERAEEPS